MTTIQVPQHQRSRPAISSFHRAKLAFLVAGFVSLVLSVTLWFSGSREEALFVGLWVPAIHSLGTLVLVGEDQTGGGRRA
jgi:hypothetical protein